MRTRRRRLADLGLRQAAEHLGRGNFHATLGEVVDPTVTWQDLEWLRSVSSLPLLVKGILTAEDARLACDQGVDGVVVSNHGGRQLDGAPASLDALPEVVDVAAGRCVVLMDGGIRRGSDVLTALALGATGVGAQTTVVNRTRIGVQEDGKKLALVKDGVSLQQLVDGLNALGIGPRDLIAILQAIKAAGAIQADIEVM